MFKPQTQSAIEQSNRDAAAKAVRDKVALETGGTPEDTHSRAYTSAMNSGLTEKQAHEAACKAATEAKQQSK